MYQDLSLAPSKIETILQHRPDQRRGFVVSALISEIKGRQFVRIKDLGLIHHQFPQGGKIYLRP